MASNNETPGGEQLINWNHPNEFPEELQAGKNRFSVDVLIFCPKSRERTIGWFDFKQMEWLFLCREVNFVDGWMWRYFTLELDAFVPEKEKRKRDTTTEYEY